MDGVRSPASRLPLFARAWILILSLCGSAADAGVNSWTNIGPDGGFTRNIVFHPSDPNIAFLHSLRLYKTTDGGVSWREILERPTTGYLVDDFAVDPTDGNRVVAIEMGQLHISTNGGDTFTAVGGFAEVLRTIEFSTDGSILYLSGDRTFYRSTDKGAHWQPQTNPSLSTGWSHRLAIDPLDSQTVLLTNAGPNHATFLTRNGGGTWQPVNIPSPIGAEFVFAPQGPSQLWTVNSGGVYTSTNYGESWSLISAEWLSAITPHPHTPGLLYAGTAFGDIRLSTNGGVSWSSVRNGARTGGVVSIAVAPSNPSRLLVGGNESVYGSLDGASSWQRRAGGLRESGISSVRATPGSDRIYATRYSGGIYRLDGLTDNPIELEPLAIDAALGNDRARGFVDVLAPSLNPDRIIASTHNGETIRSLDGGASWAVVPSTEFNGMSPRKLIGFTTNPNLLLASGMGIFRSMDGGAQWWPVTGLPADASVLDIATQGSRAYASLSRLAVNGSVTYLGVYRSDDEGSSWLPANTGIESAAVQSIAVDPTDNQRALIALPSGLKITTNAGASWTDIAWLGNPSTSYVVAIDPTNPSTIFAASVGMVGRSINSGASWENLPQDRYPAGLDYDAIAIDPLRPHRLILGTRGIRLFSIQPDLAVTGPATLTRTLANTATSVSFTARNLGPFHATRARVTIQIPSSATDVVASIVGGQACSVAGGSVTCSVGTLLTGASAQIDLSLRLPNLGFAPFTATIASDQADSATANNSTLAMINVTTASDLSMTASDVATAESTPFTFTATVSNAGPAIANNVQVVIQLGGGLILQSATSANEPCTSPFSGLIVCNVGTLGASSSAQISVTVAGLTAANYPATTFSATADNIDLVPTNNQARANLTVSPKPAATNGGGGGGGSTSWSLLLMLAALCCLGLTRRRA